MIESVNLFDGHIPYYKITKPIRLIELFAGIGSQHQALKNLGVKIDRSTIVEWQVNSIQAYNDIHIRKYDDHTQGLDKQELAKRLSEYGVSIDYNEPVKLESLMRKSEDWLRNVYNNIINTNNKVNIMSVKGSDLNIVDTNKYDYVLTYSFPCQDLSKAGLRKGMTDKTTRSGLLWEVERILSECKELPQILLMENVPDVIGSRFISDFQRWEERLRELGYSNHTEILNSKDFGIPQNRERAFMVSILGSSLYKFPQKQPLTLRLKDMLEKEVDEKYYISEKLFNYFTDKKDRNGFVRGDRFHPRDESSEYAFTITTSPTGRATDNFIDETKEFANYLTWKDSKGRLNTQDHRAYFEDRLSGTIPAMERGVPNVLLNGEPKVDVIANIRHNGTSQSGNVYDKEQLSLTLCTTDYKNPPKITEPKVNVVGNYSPSNHNASSIVDSNGIAPTVMENHGTITGVVVKENDIVIGSTQKNAFVGSINGHAPSLTSAMGAGGGHTPMITNNLRIRKLTPLECYRLMGFSDEAFALAQANQSNSSLYHQAGDSIVVNVLMELFRGLL
jgi:DNA (cytosine-5)-methyltransferase 1